LYYEHDFDNQPRLSFSRTGKPEDAIEHGTLSMGETKNRWYATRWLLDLWEESPEGCVWIDGQLFMPTDEDVADADEQREAVMAAIKEANEAKAAEPSVQVDECMPEALVHASVEIDELLHEEDAPVRTSIAALMHDAPAPDKKPANGKTRSSSSLRSRMHA
jgi:hypothetical protein